MEECPLNNIKIEFMNSNIKKYLINSDIDFEWLKMQCQNLAMCFYNKDFKTMADRYTNECKYL